MNYPTFQLGVAGKGERKRWIEIDCALIHLLAELQLFQIFIGTAPSVVRSNKRQVRFAVLRRFGLEMRLFGWRKFRLEFARDLLSEIGLDREDVGQIAVVIVRPKMLVGSGVD